MTEHHVFLSYARLDNQPSASGGDGWVTAFHRRLTAQHLRYAQRPLNVFFDKSDIADDEDWARRILQGLRSSSLFLAFLSPNYLKSKWCKREWEEYLRLEHTLARGDDGIKQIYFVETPDLHGGEIDRLPPEMRDWIADLRRRNLSQSFDLRPWFSDGADMLKELDAQDRIAELRLHPQSDRDAKIVRLADQIEAIDRAIAQRLDKALLAGLAPGNLDASYARFVGRSRELRELHTALVADKVGVVGALHGLGGQGKTALAVQYAYAYAGHYAAGGRWLLPCEGRRHLADALAPLAPLLDFTPPEPPKDLPPDKARAAFVKSVIDALERRVAEAAPRIAAALGAHKDAQTREADRPKPPANALIILDNVDAAELLSAEEMASLAGRPWLQIVVTTRLDPSAFGVDAGLAAIPVDDLPMDDALALLRNARPFADASEGEAARKIVELLGGFTLGVELVGAFLADRREIAYADYVQRLEAEGVSGADALAGDAKTRARIRHRGKQIGRIVADTMATLPEGAHEVLACAALFPPDQIVVDWLRAVALPGQEGSCRLVQPAADQPRIWRGTVDDISSGRALREVEAAAAQPLAAKPKPGYPDPWRELLRDLAGRRLLPPASANAEGGALEMVRLHRLVGQELLSKAPPADTAARRARLRAFIETLTHDVEVVWPREPKRIHPLFAPLVALVERAHGEAPDPATALALSILADIELRIGSFQHAGEMEEASNAAFQKFYEAKSGPLAPYQYATSLGKLGDFYLRRARIGDSERALKHFQQGHAIALGLRRANLNDLTAARSLSAALDHLYEFCMHRGAKGDDDRAFDILAEKQQLLKALETAFPRNEPGAPPILRDLDLARDAATFLRTLGVFYLRRGGPNDLNQAVNALELSAARFLQIHQLSGGACARDVAISNGKLSALYRRRGARLDGERAFACAEECRKWFAEFYRENPGDAQAARDLCVALRHATEMYFWRGGPGDGERALEALEEDLAISERLHDANPADAQTVRDLASAGERIGDFYFHRDGAADLDRASQAFQKSYLLRRTLRQNDPNDGQTTRDYAAAVSRLGDVFMRRGDSERALKAYEETHSLMGGLYIANSNVEAGRDLSIAAGKLSEVHLVRGELADAERALNDVVGITQHFHRADPSDAEAADDLSRAFYNLGRFYERIGDAEAVNEAFEGTFAILDGFFHRKGRPMSAAQRAAHAELAAKLGKEVVVVPPPRTTI